MIDNPCAHSDPVHTNTTARAETVSLVFNRLCSGDDGVLCRRFDKNGQKKEDKRAYNTNQAVSFNLDPGERIDIYCSGGVDDPPCRYDLSIVPL